MVFMLADNYKPVDSLFMLSQIVVEPFAELHSLSNEKQLMIFYCLIFHLLCRLLVSASGHKIGYDTFPTWHEHSFEYCTTYCLSKEFIRLFSESAFYKSIHL